MPALLLSFPEPDIAVITFDLPGKGANILSTAVLAELAAHLDQLEQRSGLAGLVIISGKPGTFIAGADLREFVASLAAPKSEIVAMCRKGQTLFQRLSQCPFVTVAAIDGICVGGGAELASWCDRRVMSDRPKTEFGFPEVKLGLYPGWGGTVRAPRLVGLANAIEMITTGEPIDARAAAAMGLVVDVAPAERLLAAATAVIRDERKSDRYLTDRKKAAAAIPMSETELVFLGATASALIQQETKGNYPAPLAALELMIETAALDADAALIREAEGMAELFGTPINAALINVFFLTDRNKRDTGLDRKDVSAASVKSVGVIGAGVMGSGIAAATIKSQFRVTLSDADEAALAKGAKSVLEEASYSRKLKGADPAKALALTPLMTASGRQENLATCDLVIEAIVENLDIKRRVYSQIEPLLRRDAILTSNTSTIPIAQLAQDLARPEQFCGLHFFNPVRRMKLVEVIRGEKTSDETMAAAVAFAKQIGKMPIVVNDGPGFMVNRLLFPYMNEAIQLLTEGASIKDIDRAATKFGMPVGPITLYDMVGLDTAMYAGRVMWEAFPERVIASPLIPAMVKLGLLGQKAGRGFFSYQNKKGKPESDPEVENLIVNYRNGDAKQSAKQSPEQITARLFLPMLLEATRLLQDKVVRDVRDIDLGLIFGLGFPPFKGGLLFWADTLGAAKILEMLKPLEHLGPRMQPTPLLVEMARTGARFYKGLSS